MRRAFRNTRLRPRKANASAKHVRDCVWGRCSAGRGGGATVLGSGFRGGGYATSGQEAGMSVLKTPREQSDRRG